MKLECASSLPYPKIQVKQKNQLYGEILLQDLVGRISEDSSIHKYLYQTVTQEHTSLEIAKVLENIAKVEMKHFLMLSKTIYLLGVDPKYRTIECFSDTPVYWKGQYVVYEQDLKKAIQLDLEQEKKVILQYQNHMTVIQDSYVQDILSRIILDEEVHVQTLEKILNIINS